VSNEKQQVAEDEVPLEATGPGEASKQVPQKIYDEIVARCQEAEQKAEKQWDAAVRARAELENYRRRAERDLENAHKYNTEKFANEMLPIIDSLEIAYNTLTDESATATREGLALTLKMFGDGLAKFAIVGVDPVNQPFDPAYHEALSMVEQPDLPANTVIMVVQKGYKIHDRLLRPARVVVSRIPTTKE